MPSSRRFPHVFLSVYSGFRITLTFSYPIIFVFTMYVILYFSWWNELIPVMADRVSDERFLNPYDIQTLRDFNLFAVFVFIFSSIINRAKRFASATSSAAHTAHEQKMAGLFSAWRNGFERKIYVVNLCLFFLLPSCGYGGHGTMTLLRETVSILSVPFAY